MIRKTVVVFLMVMATAVTAYGHGNGSVEVDIVSESGETLPSIPYRNVESGGTMKVKKYLEAKKGCRYDIVVRNNSSDRIGIVVAVDGRNVINGRKSYLGSDEEMYLVGPYGYARLNGWRTDKNTVHQFYFTSPGDSYSLRTFNDSSAMGVIAVAAFREKESYAYLNERLPQNAPAPPSSERAASGSVAEKKKALSDEAGTGFGDERYSPTVRVEFKPQHTAFNKTLIKYEWRDTLCRKGIMECGGREENRLWDEGRYAPFPPGYTK